MARWKKSSRQLAADIRIGRAIERARKASGVSGKALAEALGISRYALYLYESGSSPCPAYLLAEIGAQLAVSVDTLVRVS